MPPTLTMKKSLIILHINQGGRKGKMNSSLRMLCISDLHHYDEEEIKSIQHMEYDVCFLLGDIPQIALYEIKKINTKPLFGVCGNHDEWDSLYAVSIKDIHCKTISIGNCTIAGFGGSHRYKNGDYPMMTQNESIELTKLIPKADILISHDAPYKFFGKDTAHQGLKGISKYISKNKPKLNLCGHYHNEKLRGTYRKCKIQCIYQFKIIQYEG